MKDENPEGIAPLAEKMRPEKMEYMLGQPHLLGPEASFRRALESGRVFPVIFWGPPGSGKTTLARMIATYTHYPFRAFSAVTSGVRDLRGVIKAAEVDRLQTGQPTILFVDEIHRFNKVQQDAFLPHVESGLILLVGATTQNPSFEVIPPLLSRTRVMLLKPIQDKDMEILLSRALHDTEKGLGKWGFQVTEDALRHLVELSHGDARVALNNLEMACSYALETDPNERILDLPVIEKALDRKALPYDKDGEEHYNLISAFHKSLRGGDPQAAIYWLYRMLLAGEDPLFVARRMIRFASEDVGIADPQALQVALASFDAWQKVGPPEAELALSEAAVYLAAAPKSNALYLAEKAVKAEIERTGPLPVPLHIRNAPTSLMKKLGYGRGYRYPHNYPGAWVEQEYLPEKLKNRVFYRPTGRGLERELRRRLLRHKKT
jgi:putative ATPase